MYLRRRVNNPLTFARRKRIGIGLALALREIAPPRVAAPVFALELIERHARDVHLRRPGISMTEVVLDILYAFAAVRPVLGVAVPPIPGPE